MLVKLLTKNTVVQGILHRCGLSAYARKLRQEVAARHGTLTFRPHCIVWQPAKDRRYLTRAGKLHHLAFCMTISEKILARIQPIHRTKHVTTCDLRPPLRVAIAPDITILEPTFPEEADLWTGYFGRESPRPGDIVVDAGAYCGEITVLAARRVGATGHVYALEPDPTNRAMLKRNLLANNITNATILPFALWHSTGTLTFQNLDHMGSAIDEVLPEKRRYSQTSITVESISPRDLHARIGRRPHFYKMDIEGAELEVVQALIAEPLPAGERFNLAIASYHLREGRFTHELITPLLERVGMEVETGNPEHLTTWARVPGH